MRTRQRRSAVILPTIALTLFVRLAPAAAQVVCGDTIAPGTKVTLTADVGPCSAATSNPALRVIGGATLDMAGHSLLCNPADRPDGIQVEGKGAKILRGIVKDCHKGLSLIGEGGHKVDDFVVEGATSDPDGEGVQVDSNKNKLRRVAANGAGDDGFDVEGDGNKLQDTAAADNLDNGYEVDGAGNKLQRASAARNGHDGLSFAGNGNQAKDCVAIGNTDDGIDIDGDGNKVEKCFATRNGAGESDGGIALEGDSNQVKKNVAMDNNPLGIRAVDGAQENAFQSNVALANDTADLVDENIGGTCDANQWKKNVFGTSVADGVASPVCIR